MRSSICLVERQTFLSNSINDTEASLLALFDAAVGQTSASDKVCKLRSVLATEVSKSDLGNEPGAHDRSTEEHAGRTPEVGRRRRKRVSVIHFALRHLRATTESLRA